MNPNIKAIIFDFGGVLIRWDPRLIFRKFFPQNEQAMENFMSEISFAEWNLRQDEGTSFAQAVRDLSAEFPQYAQIIRAYDEEWEDSIPGVIPQSVRLVERLRAAGYPLYGLTNWNQDKFALVREKFEVFRLFDQILVSGQVKLVKPDPAIYRLLLENIGCNAAECLMIDDTVSNIQASKELNFQVIHFRSPAQLEQELQELKVL